MLRRFRLHTVDDPQTPDEEVRAEDDEILRQLQSTQARISIWSLLASSSTHRDALTRALSQIRVDTTTTPEGLIHMMTAGRATCIVFSDDDLPPEGSDHTRPLYISVGVQAASPICPFGQWLGPERITRREVMGTLEIELLIGPATFVAVFQVLRIPTSFNLLLGRPWIHRAGAIPSSLHQKVKFIHDGQVVVVQSVGDMFIAAEPVLEISHTDDDLFLTGFTFDEVQTVEIEDFCRILWPCPLTGMGAQWCSILCGACPIYPAWGWVDVSMDRARESEGSTDPHTFLLSSSPIHQELIRLLCEGIRAIDPCGRSLEDLAPPGGELQRLVQQLRLRDGALVFDFCVDCSFFSGSHEPYDALFPDETDEHGTFAEERVHPGLTSPFDLFGVSFIEIVEEIQTAPALEIAEDAIVFDDLIDSHVGIVEGASDFVDPPLSFDVLSGFVSRSDIVSDVSSMDLSIFEYLPVSCDIDLSAPSSPTSQIFDIDDEIAQHDSDDDSSSVSDSDPVDQRVSPAVGDTEIVDFGTTDQPRELRIGSDLSTDERDSLIQLLRAYLDVFAWSYEDMPGLDPSIVQHRERGDSEATQCGFLSVVEYPEWLANVVPVPKKDGKVRVCVDFRDLNKASPKDDFPLPHIDMLVDSTAGHSMLSFMDGFSGYSQILMAPEDMEKTSFITEWGTYCYRLLERFFERIRQFRLRLNPKKCTFGVTSGKLLGYMVSERGIEVDPDKIRAILDMPAPRTEKRKSQPTVWDDQCQRAFERIREYLLSPPVLAPPTPGRPLLLYLSVMAFSVALGCMLAQLDDSGKDRAIYYLSKRMLDYETRYVMIERYCLALVWATRRLRHYMTEYSVHLISRLDPLRYLFDRPALVGRLMRWLVLLTEFDIHYVTQKSIRGSIVADHLASLPVSDARAIDDDFPDEDVAAVTSLSGWRMYFDGAANHSGYGIETALELGIRQMEVFGDSNLVLRQIQGEWKTRDVKLRPYHAYLELLVARFEDLRYTHLPRAQNQFADALATLASMIDIPADATVRPFVDRVEICSCAATAKDKRALRQLAARFVICGETLYRRSADGMLLLCLDRASADRVMREFVQRCPECQIHGDLIHVPPSELHALTSPWPFSVWGIDIIGKISPKSSSGHEFILVAIDYFTKWVEAASYARLTSSGVASFIRSHIICRYGVPHELISDRGVHFRAEVDTLVQRYSIRHHRSSAYRPQTNGAVEAANKNIKRILRKMDSATVEIEMGSLEILEQQIPETDWAQARFDHSIS
ncbi:Retrovirus-related Pol polyprotein from transposon opus [Vitis vinifera]|uniref:Retrovirus-related Pol polyprotein from transposon opus n=1 Tax=Vitis vinifera TaxID=29760 RepID=A0A438ILL5_VITVI|nr:Retrovirus-related Pol polyprotein from transposon opus [Vitis vinifera]